MNILSTEMTWGSYRYTVNKKTVFISMPIEKNVPKYRYTGGKNVYLYTGVHTGINGK